MSSILTPKKWELVHQEGCVLVEQILRKCTPLSPENLHIVDQTYIHRSISRLDNLSNEYNQEYFSFQQHIERIIQQAQVTHKNVDSISDRGDLSLQHSVSDLLLMYDQILQQFQAELWCKLDILHQTKVLLFHILQQQISSPSTASHENTSWKLEASSGHEAQQLNHNLSTSLADIEETATSLYCIDWNGLIASFYNRAGFDPLIFSRLVSIVKQNADILPI